MEINKLGDYHELQACAWLMEQGYEVFRNVSSTGPIDIVAIKGSEVRRSNVRTATLVVELGSKHLQPSTSGLRKMRAAGIERLNAYKGHFSWTISELQEKLEAEVFY